MPKLRFQISLSLDGFIAGPSQSVDHPIGVGGMRLHQWVLPLRVWCAMHGLDGGEVNASSLVVEGRRLGPSRGVKQVRSGYVKPWLVTAANLVRFRLESRLPSQ